MAAMEQDFDRMDVLIRLIWHGLVSFIRTFGNKGCCVGSATQPCFEDEEQTQDQENHVNAHVTSSLTSTSHATDRKPAV